MEILIAVACVEGVERDGGGGAREKGRGDGPEGLHLLFPHHFPGFRT